MRTVLLVGLTLIAYAIRPTITGDKFLTNIVIIVTILSAVMDVIQFMYSIDKKDHNEQKN